MTMMTMFTPLGAILAAFVFGVSFLLKNRYGNGISRFPGPFAASLTYLWRLRDAYVNGDKRPSFVALHEKYGEIIRLGPKTLSFSSPLALDDIYGPGSNMEKSRWYMAFEAHGKGDRKENIFSTRNIHWHARYRELVKDGFTLEHLKPQEARIDDLARQLLDILDRKAAERSHGTAPVDLPLTIQYFTFDAGGVMSFSRPYGFLRDKVDLDGIIQSVRVGSMHLNRLAQVPMIQNLIDSNPLARYGGFIAPPMAFAKKHLPVDRISKQIGTVGVETPNHDILDFFLNGVKRSPGVMTENEMADLGLMVVVPASEAVRTAISVLIYQMVKHPAALKKLQQELDATFTDSNAIPQYDVASKLPFLDACIKEMFRIHPSTGFMLERVVPVGGAVVLGEYLPAGTIVGTAAWMIHRYKPTFGEDINVFRPERWLEAQPAQRAEMEKYLCPFGFGSRLCLGREIGLFEVYKMGATLLKRYEFALEKPNEDMKITWGNIVSVDFDVRVRRRDVHSNGHLNGKA